MLGAEELLLSQEYIKERKNEDSGCTIWSIYFDHKDLRLTDKEDFKNSVEINIKIMRFHFLYILQVDTVYQKRSL